MRRYIMNSRKDKVFIGSRCGESLDVPMIAMVFPEDRPYFNVARNEYQAYRLVRVRQMTEREALRLMDMNDRYIDTLYDAGLTRGAMYKLAGNSIVVSCLESIFRSIYAGAPSNCPDLLYDETFALPHGGKVNIVTLCSGYDSQCIALGNVAKELGFEMELKAWSEYDPESGKPVEMQDAVKAHDALFPQWTGRNAGDMTTADWKSIRESWGEDNEIDIMTYSTPCQSLSVAGKREGMVEGSGTKSSIVWYTADAIRTLKPKILIQENVKAITSPVNMKAFSAWIDTVSELGYDNYYTVLNARDFNVPQSRERMFMVSVRKDLNMPEFRFPEKSVLNRTLYDVLEECVGETYYKDAVRMRELFSRNENDRKNGIRYIVTDHYLTEEELYSTSSDIIEEDTTKDVRHEIRMASLRSYKKTRGVPGLIVEFQKGEDRYTSTLTTTPSLNNVIVEYHEI